MERNTVYLAGDVDAIKDFVFETSSLPQIRGGSELLQECEEEIRSRFGKHVIYCAGGSFLLEVPAHQAEEIRKAIEGIYREKTLVATVTIVAEQDAPPRLDALPRPAPGGWADRLWQATSDVPLDGGFAHRLAFLQSRMQEAKTARAIAPFYEALPFGRRCERCGRRMAQAHEQVEGGKYLCVVCKLRDEKGRKREGETEIRGRFNREFGERYGEAIRADQPQDLDTMLQPVSRKYLAFLYADGNDIGKALRRIDRPDHYQAISNALTEGTQEALYRALWDTCGPELQREERPWPFEIINIGGDDVVVLLQAGYAWEAAVRFLTCFEEEVNRRLEPVRDSTGIGPITASCGIAIADVRYPVRYLERLAADLLKEAKKRAKENPAHPRSAVTFLWLTSPIASEKVEPLMGFYRIGRDRHLTARPYTLDEARTLWEVAREMRQWPRATRHRWAEALQQGVFLSLNFIQYDVAREGAKGKEMRQWLEKLSSVMRTRSRAAPGALPIWHQVEEEGEIRWHTPLLDALELAELDTMRPDVEEEE